MTDRWAWPAHIPQMYCSLTVLYIFDIPLLRRCRITPCIHKPCVLHAWVVLRHTASFWCRFASHCVVLRRVCVVRALLCIALRRFASFCVALRRFASLCDALRRFASCVRHACVALRRTASFCVVLRRTASFCVALRRTASFCVVRASCVRRFASFCVVLRRACVVRASLWVVRASCVRRACVALRYACSRACVVRASCVRRACIVRAPCSVRACSVHASCVLHACVRAPCMHVCMHACSVCGNLWDLVGTYGNLRESLYVFLRCVASCFYIACFHCRTFSLLCILHCRPFFHCVFFAATRFLVADFTMRGVFSLYILHCRAFFVVYFTLRDVFSLCILWYVTFYCHILIHFLSQSIHFLSQCIHFIWQSIHFLSHNIRMSVDTQRVFQHDSIQLIGYYYTCWYYLLAMYISTIWVINLITPQTIWNSKDQQQLNSIFNKFYSNQQFLFRKDKFI